MLALTGGAPIQIEPPTSEEGAKLYELAERLRAQLDACLIAALGQPSAEPIVRGGRGWSPAYEAIHALRAKLDKFLADDMEAHRENESAARRRVRQLEDENFDAMIRAGRAEAKARELEARLAQLEFEIPPSWRKDKALEPPRLACQKSRSRHSGWGMPGDADQLPGTPEEPPFSKLLFRPLAVAQKLGAVDADAANWLTRRGMTRLPDVTHPACQTWPQQGPLSALCRCGLHVGQGVCRRCHRIP